MWRLPRANDFIGNNETITMSDKGRPGLFFKSNSRDTLTQLSDWLPSLSDVSSSTENTVPGHPAKSAPGVPCPCIYRQRQHARDDYNNRRKSRSP